MVVRTKQVCIGACKDEICLGAKFLQLFQCPARKVIFRVFSGITVFVFLSTFILTALRLKNFLLGLDGLRLMLLAVWLSRVLVSVTTGTLPSTCNCVCFGVRALVCVLVPWCVSLVSRECPC